MPLTHHPNGVSSFGIPVIGAGPLLPFRGNYWFVDETNGSDGGSGGADAPFKTLAQAQLAAKANNNDVVFFTGTQHIAGTLNWAKNWVHLIGLAAPGNNQRARISETGSVVFTPLVNVTGQGCMFANFATFHGFDDASAQICWTDAGGRNFYGGVRFFGMGNATAAAHVGGRSLLVTGNVGENIFEDCTIGLDTITRSAANASLEFVGGSPRNVLRRCTLEAITSSAAALHLTIGSGGIDRSVLFDRCTFLNGINSGGTAMTVAAVVNASAGGSVLLQECSSVGSTVYATTGPIYVMGSVPTGATSGLAVAAT